MDPEQTFLRVHARLSGMLAQLLTPRIRGMLEVVSLSMALVLFALVTVMHVNFVAQPGCANELSGDDISEAQLVQIKISSGGLWYRMLPSVFSARRDVHFQINEESPKVSSAESTFSVAKSCLSWFASFARKKKLTGQVLKNNGDANEVYSKVLEDVKMGGSSSEKMEVQSSMNPLEKGRDGPSSSDISISVYQNSLEGSFYISGLLKRLKQTFMNATGFLGSAQWKLCLDPAKILNMLSLRTIDLSEVRWIGKKSKIYEPSYLYTIEKGYFLLPESAKTRHNVRTVNISLSAESACFGNRIQQLLLNVFVGYDTILLNSLLAARGQGYLYNFQTKELYDLNYAQESDYLVSKIGVLIMALFVVFTTTMSVSFTLRETQSRMLKFTVQLQHHARHHLPTFQLIFVHVVESLVFVPIMIGILFFLFEFYDDQLLAFMVLTLVWLCELFTMISVRTPLSMYYFPRFFMLYFLTFHIYFFSHGYGFSYLAFAATAAFIQHLVLYFWNRFEVPALERFLQYRGQLSSRMPINSSVVLASAYLARLNSRTSNLAAGFGGRDDPTVENTIDSATSSRSEGVRVRGSRGDRVLLGFPFSYSFNTSSIRRPEDNDIETIDHNFRSSTMRGVDTNSTRIDDSIVSNNEQNINGSGISTVNSGQELQDAVQAGGSSIASQSLLPSFSSLLLWLLGGHSDSLAFFTMFRDTRDRRLDNPVSSEQQNQPNLQRSWWSRLSGLERRLQRHSHYHEE